MAGRIETYVHSDNTTPNKGGCIVEVVCDTDFSARTDEFIEFAKLAAKMSYAAQVRCWEAVVSCYPEVEERRQALSAAIKEAVNVRRIVIMKLTPGWALHAERRGLKGGVLETEEVPA